MNLPFRVAYGDLPVEKFPFEVDFVAVKTGEVVHRIEVSGPAALQVPALGEHGPIRVRVAFADGETIVSEPEL